MSNLLLLPCGARKGRGSKPFFQGWLCLPLAGCDGFGSSGTLLIEEAAQEHHGTKTHLNLKFSTSKNPFIPKGCGGSLG